MPSIGQLSERIAEAGNVDKGVMRRYVKALVGAKALPKNEGRRLSVATAEHAALLLIALAATDRPDYEAAPLAEEFGALPKRGHKGDETLAESLANHIRGAMEVEFVDRMGGVNMEMRLDRDNKRASLVFTDAIDRFVAYNKQSHVLPEGFLEDYIRREGFFSGRAIVFHRPHPTKSLKQIERAGNSYKYRKAVGVVSGEMIYAAADALKGSDEAEASE
jgi:hypothetical protein